MMTPSGGRACVEGIDHGYIYGGHLQEALQESAIDNSALTGVATVEKIWRQ